MEVVVEVFMSGSKRSKCHSMTLLLQSLTFQRESIISTGRNDIFGFTGRPEKACRYLRET